MSGSMSDLCQDLCQIEGSDRMSEFMSDRRSEYMSDRMSESTSDRMSESFKKYAQQTPIECHNLCQIDGPFGCQNGRIYVR